MWIKKPGPVTDRIVLLGREESCIYLLKGIKGAEHAIIGGGMIHIVPEVLSQLKDVRHRRGRDHPAAGAAHPF